jgi:hypothetical protein
MPSWTSFFRFAVSLYHHQSTSTSHRYHHQSKPENQRSTKPKNNRFPLSNDQTNSKNLRLHKTFEKRTKASIVLIP